MAGSDGGGVVKGRGRDGQDGERWGVVRVVLEDGPYG